MFSSHTLPLIAGLVVLAAIMVPTVLLWFTYQKYKRVARALPDSQALGSTPAGELDEKSARLTARLLEDWAGVPADELEVTRHALWTAMLLEAASDGSIDHREMKFVAGLFGRMGGEKMDFRPVISAAELVERDRRSAFGEVARAARVSADSKRQVLAGAFLVSVSDHALQPQETDCLRRIADALGLSARDRKAMLEEITRRFEA